MPIALFALSIGLQRLVVPGTRIPLIFPIFLVVVGMIGAAGRLNCSYRMFGASLSLVGWIGLSAVIWTLRGDFSGSALATLAVALATWLPCCLAARASEGSRVLDGAVRILTVVAAVIVAQFVLQVLGMPFLDPIGRAPQSVLVHGYVSHAALTLPGLPPMLRPNGLVFLEPSFAGQFAALGAALALRRRRGLVPLFLAAVVLTGSGTGVLCIAGVVAIEAVAGRGWRRAFLVASSLALTAVAVFSPFGALFSERSGEIGAVGDSGSQRFVEPWLLLAHYFSSHPSSIVFGAGPGAAYDYSRSIGSGANFPLPAQALIEFGVVPALILVGIIIGSIVKSSLDASSGVALCLISLILSGALYQAFSGAAHWSLVVEGSAGTRIRSDRLGSARYKSRIRTSRRLPSVSR